VPVLATVLVVQAIGTILALVLVLLTAEAGAPTGSLTWAAAGGIGGLVGVTALYLALSRGTMGLIAPLTGVVAASISVVISLLTGHAAQPAALLGMSLALVAVVVVAIPERVVADGAAVMGPDARARSVEWALVVVAGLGFATFFLGIDRAHGEGAGTWWTLLVARGSALVLVSAGIVALMASHRLPSFAGVAAAAPVLSLSAFGDMGGNLFYVLALGETTLAVAVVLSSLYPIATLLLARIFLGERLTRLATFGVGLAIAGVVLIGFGSTAA
jgi:drug/metabolite transporter (DMT)-like permease